MTVHQTFLAISAIALLGTSAVHAETYQGVMTPPRERSRVDVMHDAVRTAHAAEQNVVRGSRGAEPIGVSQDRAASRAEALRAAAAPHQNVSAGSRVDSRVVSTQPHPLDVGAERRAAGDSL